MPTAQRDNYDSPWKSAARRYFRHFIRFFFPTLYVLIDWSRGWRFREQELEQVSLSDKPSFLIADLLVEISLRDGEQNALLHIEVQEKVSRSLRRRMFTYFARIYTLTGLPVCSLLITPNGVYSTQQCRVKELEFNLLHIAIERLPIGLEQLVRHKNPFGLICAAYIWAKKTHGNCEARRKEKLTIIHAITAKGWSRRMARDVFRVVNWMMPLPADMERELWRRVLRNRKENDMTWMCPIEKNILRRRRKEGAPKRNRAGYSAGYSAGDSAGYSTGYSAGTQGCHERTTRAPNGRPVWAAL